MLFDNWQPTDLKAFFTEPTSIVEQKALMSEVKKVCKQWKFDGVVLEMLSQVGKYADRSVKFIQAFGKCSTRYIAPTVYISVYVFLGSKDA